MSRAAAFLECIDYKISINPFVNEFYLLNKLFLSMYHRMHSLWGICLHFRTETLMRILDTLIDRPTQNNDAVVVFSMDNHFKVSSSSVKHVCIQAGANVSVAVEQESLLPRLTITSTCRHVTEMKTLTLMGTMKSNNCSVVLMAANESKTVQVTSIGKYPSYMCTSGIILTVSLLYALLYKINR